MTEPASIMTDGPDSSAGGLLSTSPSLRLSRRVPLSALMTLLRITIERQVRGSRSLAFGLLHLVPILIAGVTHYYVGGFDTDRLVNLLIYGLIPQALIPLTALLFASGMVNDDLEERTLTYLLIRPIPKWMIYLAKIAATILVTSILASFSMLGTLAAIYWGEPNLLETVLRTHGPIVCATSFLSLAAYVPIFGALSLLARRSLIVGVIYVVVLEGLLANIDFVVRRGTVMYWVRVLWIDWLGIPGGPWSIQSKTAPSATIALCALIGAGLVIAVAGSWIFSDREFRVKTTESS